MVEMTLEKAQVEFSLFEMSILFMDIDSAIDCCGATFKEWINHNNIKIICKSHLVL